MFNKEQLDFLTDNIKAATINAISSNSPNANMWANILLELQAMPNEDTNTEDGEVITNEYIFQDFNNNNVSKLRSELANRLDLAANGLAYKIDGISYSSSKASVMLEVFISDSDKPVDKEELLRLEYMSNLPRYKHLGFTEKHFGKEFTLGSGKVCEFLGFIPKGKTYKYKARVKGTDKIYKYSDSIVALVL